MLRVSEALTRLNDPAIQWFRHKETGRLMDATADAAERLRAPVQISPPSAAKPEGVFRESLYESVSNDHVAKELNAQRPRPDGVLNPISPERKGGAKLPSGPTPMGAKSPSGPIPPGTGAKPFDKSDAQKRDEIVDLNAPTTPSAEIHKST